jgi:four helix bundle protein
VSKTLIRDYRDLLVWQKAIELALVCEELCDALPKKASHLALQIRRAANSVHSNIAEGNGRFSTPDYLRHLSISNASLKELESDLYFTKRRYPDIKTTETALQLALTVAKLLGGLVRSLRKKEKG